ncbi:mitochondrial import inner membrane translocase subunit Tim10 B-like [Acipenser ruthenus]|uniref:mitochondrial import inner membrane translocase subunit Tim10 B-like n=1 Tax=Acipenser ruthenus TaxID=7906 RepID=UPI002740DD86|nr:mitochondrial import inner membrane translocase subunit Tim10 B-like [Acipenser ruthenus]
MEQDQQQIRNLRDFLLVYNKMTDICFSRCASNLNYRTLTMDEESCLDSCAGKLIRSNHRLMGAYVKLMPTIVQRRLAEYEKKAGELPQAAEGTSLPDSNAPLPTQQSNLQPADTNQQAPITPPSEDIQVTASPRS